MALQTVVGELQELFPYVDADTIKSVLIDCNYDKNACAELLFVAQENGTFDVQNPNIPQIDHRQDVTLVYKDSVVTMNRDELVGNANPTMKQKANTLNEDYKRAAKEDEEAAERGVYTTPSIPKNTSEQAYEKKTKGTKKLGKGKEKYALLDSEINDDDEKDVDF
ncbi:hypothetical protein EIN_359350 [Entamoeba invadens IP1]|uniref:CUE domain-containing protein n=1 Tax=Entamoeba invadens IP1 TaxID=370355 RepID=A0A0A1U7N7_ENTIV|nr:hypothetical protein EIN_359350 [Entamoeba invadens IP1]ELP90852.1 hypothetical protein EIN_359350 [Entamoeba invadens IP1]|eukprot:XP_004257623.1 hypothetical protein EIN_359350 [Entamoeba invadens IP1]